MYEYELNISYAENIQIGRSTMHLIRTLVHSRFDIGNIFIEKILR